MTIFSERLTVLRHRKGESQDQLGKVLGKSREAVSKYEGGSSEPNLTSLNKLTKHYGVSLDYMVGISQNENFVAISNEEISEFEVYLNDQGFLPYLKLARKIMDHKIAVEDVENYVDSLIKYKKNNAK